MTNQNYAFISYSSKNQKIADSMRRALIQRGFHIWMAPYDIPVGHEYGSVINRALEDCGCLLLLLSGNSVESVYVNKEVERAITYRKPVIPVEIEKVVLNDSLKFFLGNTQIVVLPDLNQSAVEFQNVIATLECFITPDRNAADSSGKKSSDYADKKSHPEYNYGVKCDYGDLVEEFISKIKAPPLANGARSLSDHSLRQLKEYYSMSPNDRIIYTYKIGVFDCKTWTNVKNRFYYTSQSLIAPKCNFLGLLTGDYLSISWEDFLFTTIEDTKRAGCNCLRLNKQEAFVVWTMSGLKSDRDKWRFFYLDLQKYLRDNKHRIRK